MNERIKSNNQHNFSNKLPKHKYEKKLSPNSDKISKKNDNLELIYSHNKKIKKYLDRMFNKKDILIVNNRRLKDTISDTNKDYEIKLLQNIQKNSFRKEKNHETIDYLKKFYLLKMKDRNYKMFICFKIVIEIVLTQQNLKLTKVVIFV